MTTIATDRPTTASAPASAGQAKHPLPTGSRASRRSWTPWLIAALAVFAVGIGGWASVRWLVVPAAALPVNRMTVQPRSFSVVLHEKGELQAAKSTDIKCEVEGRSTIISLIPEGAAVEKGDLLVELASDEIENRIREEELKEANAVTAYEAAKTDLEIQRDKNTSDIRKAELQIELRRLELDKYREGEWAQRLKDADIAIEQAMMTLDRREQDYLAYKELLDKDYTTQTEFEEAEFNYKKAQWDLEKARMAKSVLEQYTHVAELKQRESDLHEAIKECERVKKGAEAEEIRKLRNLEGKDKELALIRDQLAKLRTQMEKCRIHAPTQGFVVYYTGGGRRWDDSRQIKEGAEVYERQVLMQLPDTSVMNAVVRVHEAKTNKLREGQRAIVSVEGIPDRQFTGRVTKIAVLADSQSSWLNPDLKEYETEITLDSTDALLKPGVTAHAEIMVETVDEQLAVPVQSVYAKGGARYVFRDTPNGVEPVQVELGNIGREWAEVVSGLSAGDSVLLAFDDTLKRKVPDAQPDRRKRPGVPSVQPAGQEVRGDHGKDKPGSPGGSPSDAARQPETADDDETGGDAVSAAAVPTSTASAPAHGTGATGTSSDAG